MTLANPPQDLSPPKHVLGTSTFLSSDEGDVVSNEGFFDGGKSNSRSPISRATYVRPEALFSGVGLSNQDLSINDGSCNLPTLQQSMYVEGISNDMINVVSRPKQRDR